MAKYNLNYLLKDELKYELLSRGQEINHDKVEDLRKQLRSCQDIDTSIKYFEGKFTLSEEFTQIEKILSTIDLLLDQGTENVSSLIVAKLKAKINHVEFRINNLQKCKLDATYKAKLESMVKRLNVLINTFGNIKSSIGEQDLAQFEEGLNKSLMEEEEMNLDIGKSNQPNPPVTSSPIPKSTEGPNQFAATYQPDPATQSKKESILNLASAETQVNKDYSSRIFSKLTNPLQIYLQKFPICNGLEINPLLEFLKNLVAIQAETNITSLELYEILPIYTLPPLTSKILEYKNNGLSLDNLHEGILNKFLPVLLREKLKQDLIFRPQKPQEPLGIYINEVKTNNSVLKTNLSEQELVCLIKNGIRPEIRNQLIFERNPVNFKDLDQLCINLNNVQFNDYVRVNMFPGPSSFQPNSQQHGNISHSRNMHREDRISCFNCGRRGHIAKNCYRKSKNL